MLLFAVGWPLVSLPALTAHGLLPGGPLPEEPSALGTTLLVMLPAALWVTAVADGPGAVRALPAVVLHRRPGTRPARALDRRAARAGGLMRLLVGATVRGAVGSLLAAGIVHATSNAANDEGSPVEDLLGGGQPSPCAVVAAVLSTAGALLALRHRR